MATPNGGLHAYFSGSTQPSGRLPRHHLDFKATGGYVLAPPSLIVGKPYQLIARREILPAVLDWPAITRILSPADHIPAATPAARASDPGRLTAWVEGLGEGNRNSGLFWAACRLIETGRPHLLDDLAAAATRTGLTTTEITRTINSARRTTRDPGREITP